MVESAEKIRISVAWAGPGWQGEIALSLPAGATIDDAIAASAIAAHVPAAELATAASGVWGKQKPRNHVLRDGDRVELYRPLQADPKDARRAKVASDKPRQRLGKKT
ncbi:MAG TPA: RnfH family protein [Usitatibacteraceae bacterium]